MTKTFLLFSLNRHFKFTDKCIKGNQQGNFQLLLQLGFRSRSRNYSSPSRIPFRWRRKHNTSNPEEITAKKRVTFPIIIVLATSSTLILTTSLYTRKWRDEQLDKVPSAQESGVFFAEKENYGKRKQVSYLGSKIRREIYYIDAIIERMGLMGKSVPGSKSVKEELNAIRAWHQARGYQGGVVLRELDSPLFQAISDDNDDAVSFIIDSGDEVESIPVELLPQRECYYLYYEIKSNGHNLYQIFCRGTTLLADVQTCLTSYLVYDEELGIHVHKGFRDHAQRLVEDVEPLLGHPHNPRATVEVSGHSLGGAVAMIVAMKLKKRGYNVQRVISVAGARFCARKDISVASTLLPNDTLRIEDDLDCVPFLPPWASSVGDKLWLTNIRHDFALGFESAVKYIPRTAYLEGGGNDLSWTDDIFTNLRLPEALGMQNTTHRLRSHRKKLLNGLKLLDSDDLSDHQP